MGIMVQKIVIHPEAAGPRSTTECGHGGDPVVPIPGMLDRRVAALGPHAAPQRLQQVAAFIEKYHASLPLSALFLAAASVRFASARLPRRDVRGHAAPAS